VAEDCLRESARLRNQSSHQSIAFAVEPATANDTQQSISKGGRVAIPPPPTIAGRLARAKLPARSLFQSPERMPMMS